MSNRPSSIVLACADAGIRVEDITWTTWTETNASGTGRLSENDCTPSCAAGTFHDYPATIAVSDVTASIYGPTFSELEATYRGAGPQGAAHEQFTLPVPPAPSPLCSAADLQATVDAPGSSGIYSDQDVELTNTSAQPCHMSGYPGLEILGGTGNTILNATRSCPGTLCPTQPDYLYLTADGGSAFFDLVWTTPVSGQPCSQSTSALITPPNAYDHLTVPFDITVCGQPPAVGIGTVQYAT